jgi:hypothetical protein
VSAPSIIVPLARLEPTLDQDLRAFREGLAARYPEAVPRDNWDVLLSFDRQLRRLIAVFAGRHDELRDSGAARDIT